MNKFLYIISTACFALSALAGDKSHKSPKGLVLTDTAIATVNTGSSVGNISCNGDKVFITYIGNGTVFTPAVEAQLYNNVNGKLILKNEIPFDTSLFQSSDAGGATPDFSHFVVIDDNGAGKATRIRVFDENLANPLTRIFNNIFPADQRLAFTSDGKYFAGLFFDHTHPISTLVLRVLKTDTLEIVTDYVIAELGVIPVGAASPTYFKIRKHGKELEYFAFAKATFNSSGTETLTSDLEIVKFKRCPTSTLKLITTAPLPQSPESVIALRNPKGKSSDHAILTVGTDRADLHGEPITIQVPQYSLLPDDGDELRKYKFDGKKLCLIASQNTKMDVTATEPYPKDKGLTLATSTRNQVATLNNPTESDYFGISEAFNLRREVDHSLTSVIGRGFSDIDQSYSLGSEALFSEFSLDGNWLAVFSCKGQQSGPPDTFFGTNNPLLLFKVIR